MSSKKFNELNTAEKNVIIDKGTEAPFSGAYTDFFDKGIYICKRCKSPLYKSDSKFHSGCGWPSFDDEISCAVKRLPDSDGIRTEILCANCDGHLGHVFTGEKFTDKNIRHCVNSISMKFVKTSEAIFSGGCFWGIQHYLEKVEGVIFTEVGYTGGKVENPIYEQVCSGKTGHAESVKVYFDESKVSYEHLAKLFFEIHDPTQVNRQGPDIGEQYRSAIFYMNDEQKKISEELVSILEANGYNIATKIEKAEKFYKGENYHQYYYSKKKVDPQCILRKKRF